VNRAQSETIGFILVFALITVSTGIVYVAGFSTLDDARTAENVNNMERGFDVLADNVGTVARGDAPSRATELRLGGGDLALGETVNVTVTTNVSAVPISIRTRPIVYRLDGTDIVYSAGAVFRTDRGGTVVRSGPGVVASDRQVVLPLTDVDAGAGSTAVGGDGTVLIRTKRKGPPTARSFATNETDVSMTVTVDSPRAEAWQRLFRSRGFDSCIENSPTNVSCTVETGELHVSWTTTTVEFSR
jgi:hypothetical protein